jgi:hypothetical protein
MRFVLIHEEGEYDDYAIEYFCLEHESKESLFEFLKEQKEKCNREDGWFDVSDRLVLPDWFFETLNKESDYHYRFSHSYELYELDEWFKMSLVNSWE